MKKYQLFFALILLGVLSLCWTNCSVCSISVQNESSSLIDSIKITLESESTFNYTFRNIQPGKMLSRGVTAQELKVGHYLFLSSKIYTKDSTYSGPNSATDMVFGEEKYKFIIAEGKTTLKIGE